MGSQRSPQCALSLVRSAPGCFSREEIIYSIKAESSPSDSNSGFNENEKELKITKKEDFNSVLQWTAVDFKWDLEILFFVDTALEYSLFIFLPDHF